jgi:serine/threonine protein kinase
LSTETWQAGDVIAQRYRLERQLGEGGWGEVWRAEHLTLRSHVAMKLARRTLARPDAASRLLREARAVAALSSPHVVQLLEFGLHQGALPFLVFELLEGEDLAERLDRASGPLDPGEVARVMTHVARAMTRAHEQGVVHRDLKPENVFLVQNDDEVMAKVLDFGVAKLSERLSEGLSPHSKIGALFGTPNYMSPEQLRGEEPVSYRSDLWSMAVIAFECVTGQMMLAGYPLGELMRSIVRGDLPRPSEVAAVPEGFDEWFARAAALRPEDRFDCARSMARALRAVLTPGEREGRDSLISVTDVHSSGVRPLAPELRALARR